MRACRTLYLIFSLSMVFHAYAGQPILTKSRLSDQLQQPTVSAIYRDHEAILWIGTQQGLHRYDGAYLTVFNSNKSNHHWIPESDIKDIAEDTHGNLFVATSSGALLKWDRSLETFDPIIPMSFAGAAQLTRLLVTQDGSVWFLSNDGLNLYNHLSETNTFWNSNAELLNIIGTPRDVLEDTSGNLWVAGDFGIACVLVEQKSLLFFDRAILGFPDESKLTTLEMLQHNKLIIGTDNGEILIWDINSRTSLIDAKISGASQTYISKLLLYEDRLIIGTDRGLYLSDNHLSFIESLEGSEAGVSNPNIYSLLQDGEYIWIGTIDGLDILSFSSFELFNSSNSGIPEDVLVFEEDLEGHLWVGTYDGLYLYDESTRSHIKSTVGSSSAIHDHSISSIAVAKNTLWLGMIRHGVATLNTITSESKTQKLSSASDLGITKILVKNERGAILIATYDHGLFRITGDVIKSYFADGALPEKSITVLFRANTGLLLAISGNKVYQHMPQTDQYRRVPLEFGLGGKHPVIYSIAQNASDDILIGTKDHGLFVWTRDHQLRSNFEAQPFGDRENLHYSTVYGIELDSEGNVWCSTENGILKLDSFGNLKKKFTVADGLQGNDFTLGAAFTSKAGFIYFGGMNGYNRFDPNQIEIDDYGSPIRFTNISLQGQDDSRNLTGLTNLKSLQLTHKDHLVTFQFSVLDFIDAGKNQFRYKLENFDTEWIESGKRNTATYTNLPVGSYILRIEGSNSAGIWNREGIKLNIQVLPAPWHSWWAYTIYCAALVLVGWALHRIYRSYVIDRQSAKMAQEMFDAESRADDEMQEQLELQDEIIKSAYQHNMTTLSLVSHCISARSVNLPNNMKRQLTECNIKRVSALSSLEVCISYQAGDLVADLQKYTDSILLSLVKESSVKPETIIAINDVTSMPVSAELASPISIILYELLENCMQHAFHQDTPANYIHVKLAPVTTSEPFTYFLDLSVQDSGIGVSGDIKELAVKGSGIEIVQAIVAKLGGSLQLSGVNGTMVSMTIPDTSQELWSV